MELFLCAVQHKMELNRFKSVKTGKVAAILGGGPSLPSDLYGLPADVDLIGINQHSLLLPLDLIVFSDEPMWELLKDHPSVKTSHHRISDPKHIWSGICPDYGLSGVKALWIADYLGYKEILLCGFDSYQSGRRYWHDQPDENHKSNVWQRDLRVWEKLKRTMQNPEKVNFLSGPMKEKWHED
jgi:hypothetical protein